MIQLTVYAAVTIYAGPPEELEVLQKALSVPDKNSYFRAKYMMKKLGYVSDERRESIQEYAKYIRFYDGRRKVFGTGLLFRVREKLKKAGIEYKIEDTRQPKLKFKDSEIGFHFLDKFESRPEQLEALRAALKQGCGLIHLAVNSGKTDLAAGIIENVQRKLGQLPQTLFLVHRIGLVNQTAERFKKHLGIRVHRMGSGSKSWGTVTVATIQTAYRLLTGHNKEFVKFLQGCQVVIIDELHTNAATSIQKVVGYCRARMRFGLSGTISKSRARLFKYMSMTGPIIAEIKSKELVDLGRSAKPFVRMVRIEGDDLHIGRGVKYANAYRLGVIEDRYRNGQIVKEALRYLDKGIKNCMVVVDRIDHGYELLRRFEKTELPIEYIHGSTPIPSREKVIKKFVHGKLPIMIVSPIMDTGVDIPAIRSAVMAGGGKSWERCLQKLGRTLRKKTDGKNEVYVSDFLDFHNPRYLLVHSAKRLRYYYNEGCDIKIVRPK